MSSYRFSDAERFTVYTADAGKCFWCGIPLYYRDIQVDHVFPEHLEKKPDDWTQVRANYGLGDDFAINSFENWVTCHQGCNLRKRGDLLVQAPMTLLVVQDLIRRAPRLSRFRAEFEKDVKRSRVLELLRSAVREGEVSNEDIQGLLVGLPSVPVASATPAKTSIQLTKDLKLIVAGSPAARLIDAGWKVGHVSGDIAHVHNDSIGGVTPNTAHPHPSWECSRCGSYGPWDGIICRTCGNREEAD